jgi:hypothetical protein
LVSPESFTFTLTVPGDTRLVGVVRDLCAHAAGYARLPEPAGASFCDRVADAAGRAVAAQPHLPCPLEFHCDGAELRVIVAGRTITQSLSV